MTAILVALALTAQNAAGVETALREKVRQAPGSFEANHQLAEFYAHQGKVALAIPYFEKARTADPNHYVNGYDLSLAYMDTGNGEKARQQITTMMQREDRAELHNLMGAVEEQAKRIEPAAREYQRAAEMDPSEKHVFDFANCLLRYNAGAKAQKIFEYGVDKYPKSARMRVGLGIAFYSVGQYDQAVESLCQGVDLDPNDSRPLTFLGMMYDISPALSDEVTKRLAHLVEVYPKNAAANYYYAVSLWKRTSGGDTASRLPKVEALLQKAVTLDPKLADAHFQLGILYQEQSRLPQATREFELAVKLRPDVDTFHYRLGQVYRESGQEEKAKLHFARYKELHERKVAVPDLTKQ